jgi:protein-tyrosine-phosphatase
MAEAVAKHLLPAGTKIGSCGVYKGAPDPFVAQVLREADMSPPSQEPREFGECDTGNYDLIIALTPEAAAEARRFHRNVRFWEVENPTDTRGSDAEILEAYRRLRDSLVTRIEKDFGAR